MNVDHLADRIRAEFEEMPELILTVAQASRFFGIDQETTRSVMERLVAAAHLRVTRTGALARAQGT